VGRRARFEGHAEAHVASAPMNQARIDVEPDPVPIVLILAATLRRAARTPKLAAAIGHVKGNVALRSTVDPQAATMRFGNGGVTVVRGVSDDADVIIAADINKLSDGTWQEEAQRFFAYAIEHPGIPRSMRVVCTDDGSELTLGDAPAEYELHGSEHALLNVFCGNSVIGQDLLDGKIFAVGKLAHLAELTGRSLAWMLGG
jgi:hypothetical protein